MARDADHNGLCGLPCREPRPSGHAVTTAFSISDAYVDQVFAMSPLAATSFGVPGCDHLWDDFSPAANDEWAALWRRTREELVPFLDDDNPHEVHAAAVLLASLDEQLRAHDAGDHLRD